MRNALIYPQILTEICAFLTLLHSEWPKLHRVLAILSAIGLLQSPCFRKNVMVIQNSSMHTFFYHHNLQCFIDFRSWEIYVRHECFIVKKLASSVKVNHRRT